MRTSKAKFVSKNGRGLVQAATGWEFAKWDKIENNKARSILFKKMICCQRVDDVSR